MRTFAQPPRQSRKSASSDPVRSTAPSIAPARGQQLDAHTRGVMGAHFGYDFSRVRVFSDEEAAGRTSAANAVALTSGQDIFFAPGAYSPYTLRGAELLGHELAHVVQQSAPGAASAPAALEASARRAPLEHLGAPSRRGDLGTTGGKTVQAQVHPYTQVQAEALVGEIEAADLMETNARRLIGFVNRLRAFVDSPVFRNLRGSERARVERLIYRVVGEVINRPARDEQSRVQAQTVAVASRGRPGEGVLYRPPPDPRQVLSGIANLGPVGSLTFVAAMLSGRDADDAMARAQFADSAATIALTVAGAVGIARGGAPLGSASARPAPTVPPATELYARETMHGSPVGPPAANIAAMGEARGVPAEEREVAEPRPRAISEGETTRSRPAPAQAPAGLLQVIIRGSNNQVDPQDALAAYEEGRLSRDVIRRHLVAFLADSREVFSHQQVELDPQAGPISVRMGSHVAIYFLDEGVAYELVLRDDERDFHGLGGGIHLAELEQILQNREIRGPQRRRRDAEGGQ
jgi:hypothetical protein